MKRERLLVLSLCFSALLIPVLGCGKKDVKNDQSRTTEITTEVLTEDINNTNTDATNADIATPTEAFSKEIECYYFDTNTKQIEQTKITINEDSCEAILTEMQNQNLISKNIKILSSDNASSSDGKTLIDINFNTELNSYMTTSGAGQMIVYSLANTYIDNFKVDYVNFKVDGKTLVYNDCEFSNVEYYEPSALTQIDYNTSLSYIDTLEDKNTSALNTFYSPVSIDIDMAILYNGVDDSTKTMINDYKDPQTFASEFSQSDLVKFSNGLFYNNTPDHERKFKSSIEKKLQKYRMLYSPLNYTKEQTAKDEINNFVKNQTSGNVTSIIDSFTKNDNMYLVNAMDFKFDFKDNFSEVATTKITDFTGQNQEVQIVNGTTKGLYLKSSDVEGCVIDLKDDYKLILLNPSQKIKKASDIDLNKLMINGYEQNLSIQMPMINTSYKNTNNELLTNIQPNIMTSGVGYHNFFEGCVDEIGIEDVHTAIHFEIANNQETSSQNEQIDHNLKFDKPFYFAVVNSNTNNIVIIGHYGFINQ